jgi:hypothetical protein
MTGSCSNKNGKRKWRENFHLSSSKCKKQKFNFLYFCSTLNKLVETIRDGTGIPVNAVWIPATKTQKEKKD